jgi:hypothetical protein
MKNEQDTSGLLHKNVYREKKEVRNLNNKHKMNK